MNMHIEDQRAVENAAGPAGSSCATFGPGPQACRAAVMPLQEGASQFNLLKPVKGGLSQFADKVHPIPGGPSSREAPKSSIQSPVACHGRGDYPGNSHEFSQFLTDSHEFSLILAVSRGFSRFLTIYR
jgi:hypothetical protein